MSMGDWGVQGVTRVATLAAALLSLSGCPEWRDQYVLEHPETGRQLRCPVSWGGRGVDRVVHRCVASLEACGYRLVYPRELPQAVRDAEFEGPLFYPPCP